MRHISTAPTASAGPARVGDDAPPQDANERGRFRHDDDDGRRMGPRMSAVQRRERDPAAKRDQGDALHEIDHRAKSLRGAAPAIPRSRSARPKRHARNRPARLPTRFPPRPALLPREQRGRQPVIGHDCVQHADCDHNADQEELRTSIYGTTSSHFCEFRDLASSPSHGQCWRGSVSYRALRAFSAAVSVPSSR